MRNVLALVAILTLAVMAGACGSPSSPTSPSGVVAPAGFTLTRLLIGLANEGVEETGRLVSGPVTSGTKLKYNLYFTGPAANGLTFTYRTDRGDALVDTTSFVGGSSMAGVETRTSVTFTPMSSGTYTVQASISVAPDTASATFEVR